MAFPESEKENQTTETVRQEVKTEGKFDRSIVEGPLGKAIWKIGAPTILANIFGGIQGLVDHIIVGNVVGKYGNAAIGVSWQIFLVVVVLIASIFTGMGIMVSRFAGASEPDKVNRTVYQAFITALFFSFLIIAPTGYFLSPYLLKFVNSEPRVQIEALPYLRIMFLYNIGLMIFFMLAGALRSAGDAKTPMVLGITMTVMNLIFNIVLISGFGPIPAFGTKGAAMGTCIASGIIGVYSFIKLCGERWVVSFKGLKSYAPEPVVIRKLFQFGLPAGFQGIAMNIGGVMLLSFIGSLKDSADAQAAYAVAYGQLFSFVTWISVGLMGAAAAITGQNIGAGNIERAGQAVRTAARFALAVAVALGVIYFFFAGQLLAIFGLTGSHVTELGVSLLRVLAVSGLFVSVALTYTGGLQGSGDTKSPLFISIISQVIMPLSICFITQATVGLSAIYIWFAILAGHATRCVLTVLRFNQNKWQGIKIDLAKSAG
ncbi:MAG: MATE family efflux transporter [Pyrinomonadaceae bacterium]